MPQTAVGEEFPVRRRVVFDATRTQENASYGTSETKLSDITELGSSLKARSKHEIQSCTVTFLFVSCDASGVLCLCTATFFGSPYIMKWLTYSHGFSHASNPNRDHLISKSFAERKKKSLTSKYSRLKRLSKRKGKSTISLRVS